MMASGCFISCPCDLGGESSMLSVSREMQGVWPKIFCSSAWCVVMMSCSFTDAANESD